MLEAESFGTLIDGTAYSNQHHHSAIYFSDDGNIIEYRDYLDTLNLCGTVFDQGVAYISVKSAINYALSTS